MQSLMELTHENNLISSAKAKKRQCLRAVFKLLIKIAKIIGER
jgi:hypothetical protein